MGLFYYLESDIKIRANIIIVANNWTAKWNRGCCRGCFADVDGMLRKFSFIRPEIVLESTIKKQFMTSQTFRFIPIYISYGSCSKIVYFRKSQKIQKRGSSLNKTVSFQYRNIMYIFSLLVWPIFAWLTCLLIIPIHL